MPLLTRITTEYSETEDRIRLAGLDEAGQNLTLWLTRRLADRLFASILAWLDAESSAQAGSDMLQSFEQQAAVSSLTPTEPVQPAAHDDPDASGHQPLLIVTVDITKGDQGVIFAFKDASGSEAKLAVTKTELRQWLAICHRCYMKADWPLTLWPHWMSLDDPRVPAIHSPLMH